MARREAKRIRQRNRRAARADKETAEHHYRGKIQRTMGPMLVCRVMCSSHPRLNRRKLAFTTLLVAMCFERELKLCVETPLQQCASQGRTLTLVWWREIYTMM